MILNIDLYLQVGTGIGIVTFIVSAFLLVYLVETHEIMDIEDFIKYCGGVGCIVAFSIFLWPAYLFAILVAIPTVIYRTINRSRKAIVNATADYRLGDRAGEIP